MVSLLGNSAGTTGQEFVQFDSTYALMPAFNDGVRRVAIDIGVFTIDTLTIADNTFQYTLNTDFMEVVSEGDATAKKYSAVRISANGKSLGGLKLTPLIEFQSSESGTSGQNISPNAMGFSVLGNKLWLYPAGTAGDKVYVSGPAEGIPVTHGADTTNIYDSDMWAVVYWGTSQLAKSAGEDALALEMQSKYIAHVLARTGRAPQLGGQQ